MISLTTFDVKEITTSVTTVDTTTWRTIILKDKDGNELEVVIFGSKKDLKIKEK